MSLKFDMFWVFFARVDNFLLHLNDFSYPLQETEFTGPWQRASSVYFGSKEEKKNKKILAAVVANNKLDCQTFQALSVTAWAAVTILSMFIQHHPVSMFSFFFPRYLNSTRLHFLLPLDWISFPVWNFRTVWIGGCRWTDLGEQSRY